MAGDAVTLGGRSPKRRKAMLGTILIVFLILALIGATPRWSHSRDWGYFPTGGVGLVLVVVVVLVLLGRI
jgi:FtsH-binding integral membrane protein